MVKSEKRNEKVMEIHPELGKLGDELEKAGKMSKCYQMSKEEHIKYLLAANKLKSLQVQYAPAIHLLTQAQRAIQSVVQSALNRVGVTDTQIDLDEATGTIKTK